MADEGERSASAPISVVPTTRALIGRDAVEKLTHLLEMARAAEIESFVTVAFKPDGNWIICFSGQIDTLKKVGALEAIKIDLLATL